MICLPFIFFIFFLLLHLLHLHLLKFFILIFISTGIITHQSHISQVSERALTQSVTNITSIASCDAIHCKKEKNVHIFQTSYSLHPCSQKISSPMNFYANKDDFYMPVVQYLSLALQHWICLFRPNCRHSLDCFEHETSITLRWENCLIYHEKNANDR